MSERIWVDSDEWYPVYSINSGTGFGYEISVPDGFSDRWDAAYEEFRACQAIMSDLVRGEPDPVLLPEPTDFVLDVDAAEALHFKAGDTLRMGEENMVVVTIDGGRVMVRKAVVS